MAKHAYLSASASHRWLACPPSAKLCAQEEDQSSVYSQQGTCAHELGQYLVEKALGKEVTDPTNDLSFYDSEMQEAAEGYAAFVMEQVAEARKHCTDPLVCVEQTLDFSKWVEHGFGTGDCVIVADDLLQIIDLKYGTGVLVSASGEDGSGNSQLKCYALGALDTFGDLYDIRRIRLTIYQPRRDNVDSFDLSVEELLNWAGTVLAPRAKLAYEGKGDFHAGDHCQFCKIKATCRARAEYFMELAVLDFPAPPTLSNEEIAQILEKAEKLTTWAEDLKAYALQQALKGEHFPEYKLVEGRSSRKFTDEETVAKIVEAAGYEPYSKKLLGITELSKQLGKKKFEELLSSYIVKPHGKPVLVPVTDKRPIYSTVEQDFD